MLAHQKKILTKIIIKHVNNEIFVWKMKMKQRYIYEEEKVSKVKCLKYFGSCGFSFVLVSVRFLTKRDGYWHAGFERELSEWRAGVCEEKRLAANIAA